MTVATRIYLLTINNIIIDLSFLDEHFSRMGSICHFMKHMFLSECVCLDAIYLCFKIVTC